MIFSHSLRSALLNIRYKMWQLSLQVFSLIIKPKQTKKNGLVPEVENTMTHSWQRLHPEGGHTYSKVAVSLSHVLQTLLPFCLYLTLYPKQGDRQ